MCVCVCVWVLLKGVLSVNLQVLNHNLKTQKLLFSIIYKAITPVDISKSQKLNWKKNYFIQEN